MTAPTSSSTPREVLAWSAQQNRNAARQYAHRADLYERRGQLALAASWRREHDRAMARVDECEALAGVAQ